MFRRAMMKGEGVKRKAYRVILNKCLFIKFNITVKSHSL
jgi:hypothetical protein